MVSYYLYTYDDEVFTQLTTSPTKEQSDILADYIVEDLEDFIDDYVEEGASIWPTDRDELSEFIRKRLAMQDWFSDLTDGNDEVWDEIVNSLLDEPGEKIGIDIQCDVSPIVDECAAIAVEQGVTMMRGERWGSSRFRDAGRPDGEYSDACYSIYTTEQCKELLAQLEKVEPYFESLPAGEGTPGEAFFESLYPEVQEAVEKGRGLWVAIDM
jgi:hypothetical protein